MRHPMRRAVALSCSLALFSCAAAAEDWPAWRGPRSDGTSEETNLPVRWSTTDNVKWKIPLPDRGNSTPIVLKDRIFLTQATAKGAERSVLALDRASGTLLWRKSIAFDAKEPTHEGNPYCSASPVTDGKAVYAWHGSAGVVAYDLDGKELWQRDLGKFTHIWGNAGSPVVYKNLLILNASPGERAFVVALDKTNGQTVWEQQGVSGKADAFLGSWSSPQLVSVDGQDLVLVAHPHALVAYEAASGKEVFKCSGLTDLVYTTPVVRDKIVVAMSGYTGRALAMRLGGTGDVTDERRLWITPEGKKEQQRIGSGIIRNEHMMMVNEPGVGELIDLASGDVVWKDRVSGTTWSSLVWADGRYYILDQKGTTTVFTAEPKLQIVATNALGEATNASHAISQGNLYIRTDKHLWCIGP